LRRQKWLNEPALQKLLRMLNQAGEARIAGGAVRNALLRMAITDVDIATTLAPTKVIELAREHNYPTWPTGVSHGTVSIGVDGRVFEVTTLRIDTETYGRRARVRFTDNWHADALRRDFTINAMFCDAKGRLYDPVGGYGDVKRGKVQFIGDPRQRILEDHLRILRFFRLHASYGRGGLDVRALKQCARMRNLLLKLSPERVRGELFKLLVARAAPAVAKAMVETGVLQVVLGKQLFLDDLQRMTRIDATHGLRPDALLRLECLTGRAAIFSDRLKLTNAEVSRLLSLRETAPPVPALRPRERRIVRHQFGKQRFDDAVRLAWARSSQSAMNDKWRQLLRFGETSRERIFPIRGEDLLARGYSSGPGVGRTLRALEDWWVAQGFPDRNAVLARLASIGGDLQSAGPTDDNEG
jgi:poly(A) polymerase